MPNNFESRGDFYPPINELPEAVEEKLWENTNSKEDFELREQPSPTDQVFTLISSITVPLVTYLENINQFLDQNNLKGALESSLFAIGRIDGPNSISNVVQRDLSGLSNKLTPKQYEILGNEGNLGELSKMQIAANSAIINFYQTANFNSEEANQEKSLMDQLETLKSYLETLQQFEQRLVELQKADS